MNTTITMSVAQLTLAQMGKDIYLNTGEVLCAVRKYGCWCYMVAWEGQLGLMRYASEGLEAALWALNSSQEEYDAEPKPWE